MALSYYRSRHGAKREVRMRPVSGPLLGIESSCDETAVAVLDSDGLVLAESVLSQELEHAPYGGVVPEIAARTHLAHLPELVERVMARAGAAYAGLAGVAATGGPGLIGGLIVGSSFAKGVSIANCVPYIAVNHLEAHALTARLPGLVEGGAPFPYLLLLVSGGHCQCVQVDGVAAYHRLGGTADDAAGEAFDKVAKLLGLGWPGGPALERLAARGDPGHYAFPRPMKGRPGCDFSFSGLKTAVAQEVARHGDGALPEPVAADLAAGFQQAVVEVLADRAAQAIAMTPDARLLVVAGGVAANEAIRRALARVAAARGVRLAVPPVRLCTDNAVMVAWAGIERLRLGLVDGLDFAPRPRWPLEALRTTSPSAGN
jgi:N6-L-threonylcarbamoyladenine synthase